MRPLLLVLSRLRRTRPAHLSWPSQEVRRWLVLQQNTNPSTDYYIKPALTSKSIETNYRDIDKHNPRPQDFAPGTGVIIVRYLNPAWAKSLRSHRHQLSEVVYFMDDDLLEPAHWRGLPDAYVKKLNTYCRPYLADVRQLASEYWFSTPALLARYEGLRHARVMPPRPLADDRPRLVHAAAPDSPVWLFYHGTAAHQTEMEWLHPIVQEVLRRCPRAHLEVIGNHDVNRLFRDLPRTRVLHPMSWTNFQSHCRALQGHIGLAPLLPSPFNAGRSHTKVFDIARCAAVGVYSAGAPYDTAITHGQNGLLLPNEVSSWVETLCQLVNDDEKRDRLRQGAAKSLQLIS